MGKVVTVKTYNVRFERRRYGRATYCWASVDAPDGTSIELGDPWPGINWPRAVLDPLVRAALARYAGRLDEAEAASAEAVQAQVQRRTSVDRLDAVQNGTSPPGS